MSKSNLELQLTLHMKAHKLPDPVCEHVFLKDRKYRFDFAWPSVMLAVEVEGGTWVNGRHNRGSGFESDCTKYNLAALDGWVVLRFTKDMIEKGIAIETLKRAFKMLEDRPIALWPAE